MSDASGTTGAGGPAPAGGRQADHNIIAYYPSIEAAREAAIALERKGIEAEEYEFTGASMSGASAPVTNSTQGAADVAVTGRIGRRSITGLLGGAVIGALLGLGASLIYFNLIADGELVTAGVIGAVLGGAAFGAFLGGFYGGFTALPANEEALDTFEAEAVENASGGSDGGSTCIAVHSDDPAEVDKALEALRTTNPQRLAVSGRDGKQVEVH